MTGNEIALTLAILAQLVFTFVVMVRAGRARFRAGKAGELTGPIALGEPNWPKEVTKRANNMNNQFETPTLFYALAILALVLKAASLPIVVLAWGFIVSRVVHAAIHTGSNQVILRFRAFFAGVICLMVMTLLLILHVVSQGWI